MWYIHVHVHVCIYVVYVCIYVVYVHVHVCTCNIRGELVLAQSCTTPPYVIQAIGYTHDCASILDSIAKGNSLFP